MATTLYGFFVRLVVTQNAQTKFGWCLGLVTHCTILLISHHDNQLAIHTATIYICMYVCYYIAHNVTKLCRSLDSVAYAAP